MYSTERTVRTLASPALDCNMDLMAEEGRDAQIRALNLSNRRFAGHIERQSELAAGFLTDCD
jgi:hypothetical protein